MSQESGVRARATAKSQGAGVNSQKSNSRMRIKIRKRSRSKSKIKIGCGPERPALTLPPAPTLLLDPTLTPNLALVLTSDSYSLLPRPPDPANLVRAGIFPITGSADPIAGGADVGVLASKDRHLDDPGL